MAKDLILTRYDLVDKNGTNVSFPSTVQVVVNYGTYTKEYFVNTSNMVLTYDSAANYFEIYSQSHCIYKYEPGDTYNGGGSVTDASTMASNVVGDTMM
jgi:hypothetical protein